MIPIQKLDGILLFLGLFFFSGAFDAALTTFDPNFGGSGSSGNIKMQLASGTIYLFCIFLVCSQLEKFLKFSSRNMAIFFFIAIPVFSIFWSIDPVVSTRRVIALLGTCLFGVYIAYAIPPERLIRALAVTYSLIALASILFIVFLPSYGTHQTGEYAGVWRGIYSQKNEFGASMAMGILALALCHRRNQIETILCRSLLVLCCFLLMMSESRAAWISLAAAALVAMSLYLMSGRGFRTTVRVLTFISALIVAAVVIYYQSDSILAGLGKEPTLTGRTGVWELAIEKAMLRPMFGYGYRAYWTEGNKLRLKPEENWSDGIGHAHNTYVDIFVELGFIGLSAFSLMLFLLLINLFLRITWTNDCINSWSSACIVFIFIRGFAESTMLQHADMNWFLFIYIFILMNEERRSRSLIKKSRSPIAV